MIARFLKNSTAQLNIKKIEMQISLVLSTDTFLFFEMNDIIFCSLNKCSKELKVNFFLNFVLDQLVSLPMVTQLVDVDK